MRNFVRFVTILCCLAAVAAPGVAGPRDLESRQRFRSAVLDGPPATVENPLDGSIWMAWAYRSGGQFDIALSMLDTDGYWTRPVFIGADDGIDQIQPALAADAAGNLYLAYAERGTHRVMVTHRRLADDSWSAPHVPGPELFGRSPELSVVADRLVLAFQDAQRIRIVDLPVLTPEVNGVDFTDGPDPIGATDEPPEGSNDSRDDTEYDTSAFGPVDSASDTSRPSNPD